MAEVVVVVPALNEAACLPEVLRKLGTFGFCLIIVVDNGSTDATAEVARRHGARVIPETRRGYGQACWTGCSQLPDEARWILFCNADGSDDLDALPRMWEAALGGAEFVLGARQAGPDAKDHLTGPQRFGNGLATRLIGGLWGISYLDLGPLRLISRNLFDRLAMKDRGFGWTVEMQVRAAEEKARVVELPVRSFARIAGESKISGTVKGSVQAGWVILSSIGKLWLGRPAVQQAMSWLSVLFLLLGAVLMTPWGALGNVPGFLAAAAVMGLGYVLSWTVRRPVAWVVWTGAIVVRVILLFMEPGNDIWRYMWEGQMTLAGSNPYQIPPDSAALAGFRDTVVWPRIGFPSLTTVYPPVAQLLFAGLAALSPTVILFKSAFLCADLGVALLLHRRFGLAAALLYAWNPLVIYSFAGGGHYDSFFLLPLTAALLLAGKETVTMNRWYASALLMGASVAVKWISGPLAFWWLWQSWKRGGIRRTGHTGLFLAAPLALTWWLVFPGTAWHQLGPHHWLTYARSAQALPWLLERLTGFAPANQVYVLPVLCIAAWIARSAREVQRAAARFFFMVLVLSPAIHGWYFTWFIAVAAPLGSWSARLIGLSGFAYFWVLHVNSTQGVWEINGFTRLLLWLPFLLPFLWERSPRRADSSCPSGTASAGHSTTNHSHAIL